MSSENEYRAERWHQGWFVTAPAPDGSGRRITVAEFRDVAYGPLYTHDGDLYLTHDPETGELWLAVESYRQNVGSHDLVLMAQAAVSGERVVLLSRAQLATVRAALRFWINCGGPQHPEFTIATEDGSVAALTKSETAALYASLSP